MKTTIINGIITIPPTILTYTGRPEFAAIYLAVITGIWTAVLLYE
jgi:hypothetical protein